MKPRKSLLIAFATVGLLCGGPLIAQNTAPQTPPQAPMDTAPAPAGTAAATATMNTPAGELVVHSSMPPPPPSGPAPAFEQLSGGGKYISEEQASAYPLLANDFLYADHNRDGRISKSEYARWTAGK
ncbi:hypothetical protein LRK24_07390 [Rhodanobacter denitrificans]|uniref:hypothetical protein n=1 Tax=Rhodanobacter denitrificans TaxID=666685 RepID=UPI000260F2E4|nr:hypothetical protein [Rhodanobacter denitrificans]EIM04409.1 hypothetical protein UUC_02276 [Rhodanobacter denitrificans]UJM91739.1 hypothetical protein LRK24_07390 [Rhodanobacter denitrificans]